MQEESLSGYRLSSQQRHLWSLLRPRRNRSYEVKCAVRIKGRLERGHLRTAAQKVITRHEILRTTFQLLPGMTIPMQVIEETGRIWWEESDLSGQGEQAALVEQYFEAASDDFDFERGPFLRLHLIKLNEEERVMIARLPAICADWESLRNVARDLSRSYEAVALGEELDGEAPQYADLAEWQNELIEAEETRIGREFWRNRNLARRPAPALAFEREPESKDSFEPRLDELIIDPQLKSGIESVARNCRTSVEAILLACWQILLWRHTGQPEIEVGAAFDGRDIPEIEGAVGLFAKYLPVTGRLDDELQFGEFVGQISKSLDTVRDWQEYFSWEQIVGPPSTEESEPFFPYCFEAPPAPADFPAGVSASPTTRNVSFTIFREYGCIDRFKIKLSYAQRSDARVIEFHYDAQLFRPAEVGILKGQFHTLVESVVGNPAAKVGDLEMTPQAERRRLLFENNETRTDWGSEKLLPELFCEQARRTPDAVAVIYEEDALSYGELNERANRLAQRLRDLGVGPEVVVGLCLERSLDLMVSLMASLKAGGAYLPLDPSHPEGRLAFMLKDAEVKALLTQRRLRSQLPKVEQAEVICVDELWESINDSPAPEREAGVLADNLAYIIYTSGSTGAPKGVMLRHGSLKNYLLWAVNQYPVEEGCGSPVHSSLSFDLTITGLFAPLLVGRTVHLLSADGDIEALGMALAANHEYSLVKLTPAHLRIITEQLRDCDLEAPPKSLVVGGENLPSQAPRWWVDRGRGTRVFNEYGPTESVVGCSVYEVGTGEEVEEGRASVPIGRPIANTRLYLMDGRQRVVGIGVSGEVWIGGEGLARGYLKRPDLTAEKFVPNPYGRDKGERLYRSGDLGRYLAAGQIECLGRIDDQVKIRGYRIELGEIEAALNESRSVRQSVVVASEDGRGDKRLLGYVVGEEGATVAELKRSLRERLPEYMVPEAIVILDEMPVTANGKIDRKRLPPAPDAGSDVDSEYVAARTPVEEIVVGIYEDVLKLDRVGIHDNFFEMGGHSLLATQIVSRVRNAFGIEIGVRSIFKSGTAESLSQRIEEAILSGEKVQAPPMIKAPREGQNGLRLPLSFAQQRLWFLDQLAPNNPFYNIPTGVRLEGRLNLEALERVINEIVRRHEVLRTRFEVDEGAPVQVIDLWEPRSLEVEDLISLAPEEREAEVRRRASEDAATGFDLRRGPLLRVKVLKLDDEDHAVLFTMHHIVSDGWSMGILISEIGALYQSYSVRMSGGGAGEESPLDELPIQYADFAVWQRNWLQGEVLESEVGYWKERLKGAAVLEMPTDFPRPASQSYRGGLEPIEIGPEVSESLRMLTKQEGATLFMVLMAAFKLLLMRYSGEEDVVVGTAVANRTRKEVEGLIGFFVNTLVLRTDLGANPSFRELIRREREVALGAYAHQEAPFEKLVEEINPERDLSRSPLFQVMMSLQNTSQAELEIRGLKLSRIGEEIGAAKFDLELMLTESGEGIAGSLMYSRDLYEAETIRRMARRFAHVVAEAVRGAERRVREIELMDAAEKRQILEEWNKTQREYGEPRLVHEMIADQARRSGETIAVISEQGALSYGELNRRANRLVHYLMGRGVGREDLVGICAERSLEMVIAILGVLKAGAAYVPIDTADPRQRIEGTLGDAEVKLLLTQEAVVESLELSGQELVCLDREWDRIERCGGEEPEAAVDGEGLAYVIYTSGSTGKPKGAMNTHAGIRNRLLWMQEQYGLEETDRVLQKTTFSFDVSVWEFLWPLMTGAALVMARPGGHKDGGYLLGVIKEEEITTAHFVPSMLGVFLEERVEEARSLRRVICSGEALPRELEESARKRTGAEVSNLYGPTEAAIDVTYWICNGEGVVGWAPIGKPIANTETYVLDSWMEATPVGVKGEIYIGGAGLARGYLRRGEMTAERFMPSRYGVRGGERMYRTGDVGKYLADGNIEFIGRADNQVKIRGYRIELGEIEAVLNEHQSVKQSVVAASEDGRGGKRLLGYVVGEEWATAAELKRYLRERLPEYMVPEAIVILDEMPVTANGKIDRKRLPPAPGVGSNVASEYVAARTPVEEMVVGIYEEVLKLDRVGIHDNFFEMGGHSLLATQIVSRVKNAFGVAIEVRNIFEDPTAEALGRVVEGAIRASVKDEPPLPGIVDRPDALPSALSVPPGAENGAGHKERAAQEESDIRKLRAIKRKGINLSSEPA
jgi:amino acid adenylation domain-containing protein